MRVPAWRHVLVVAFLVLIWGLGLQGLLRQDGRYAWGMFSTQIVYTIEYRFETRDRGRVPYAPGKELRHRAYAKLAGRAPQGWRYGIGGLRTLTATYLDWLLAHHAPPDATAAVAIIRYRENEGAERETLVRRERGPSS